MPKKERVIVSDMKEIDKIKTIWEKPKNLILVQPELTDEVLYSTEKILGKNLPKNYIEMLKIQNGGSIRYRLRKFPFPCEIYGIGHYYPSLLENDYERSDDLVPFGGDGPCYFCFDYRLNNNEAKITYIDLETDKEKVLYDNFDEYIHSLELYTEYSVIETEKEIDEIKILVEKILNIKMEKSIYNFGYTLYQGKFNNQYFWISPNKVPRGFVQEHNERYEELKSQIEGTELQYPEIPDGCVLLSAAVRKEITKELLKNDVKIVELKEYIKKLT